MVSVSRTRLLHTYVRYVAVASLTRDVMSGRKYGLTGGSLDESSPVLVGRMSI